MAIDFTELEHELDAIIEPIVANLPQVDNDVDDDAERDKLWQFLDCWASDWYVSLSSKFERRRG